MTILAALIGGTDFNKTPTIVSVALTTFDADPVAGSPTWDTVLNLTTVSKGFLTSILLDNTLLSNDRFTNLRVTIDGTIVIDMDSDSGKRFSPEYGDCSICIPCFYRYNDTLLIQAFASGTAGTASSHRVSAFYLPD